MLIISQQLLVWFLACIVYQVSARSPYKVPVTCYTKYDHEETRNQASSNVSSYAYSEAETTQYATSEGDDCAAVGCMCYSYQSACSHSSHESNYFTRCTDADRRNRVVKWHRGLTSRGKCDEMRQQPEKYLNLTCCWADRCNDQPEKMRKFIHPNMPTKRYGDFGYRNTSYTNRPSQYSDQTLQTRNSLSSITFSSTLLFFALLFSRIFMI